MIYNDILTYLNKCTKPLYNVSIGEQLNYLNSIPEPKDDFQRSFAQFKCQFFFYPLWLKVLINTASFFSYIFVLFFLLLKRRTKIIQNAETLIDIGDRKLGGTSSVVPDELKGTIIRIEQIGYLTIRDALFCLKIVSRFFFAPYFCFKFLFKVAQYRYAFDSYHPNRFAVRSEFSFTSSIMTVYCNRLSVEHINFMHGEKTVHIRDSFFHFNKCYVWDKYYIDLFIKLRADTSQFVLSIPPSLSFDLKRYEDDKMKVDYKYYLTDHNANKIMQVVDILKIFKNQGYTIMIRPHPKYTDMNVLRNYADERIIEDVKEVTIQSSISNTKNVISDHSTVLSQAYYVGKPVIIDNIVSPEIYQRRVEVNHISLSRTHRLLSEVMTNVNC